MLTIFLNFTYIIALLVFINGIHDFMDIKLNYKFKLFLRNCVRAIKIIGIALIIEKLHTLNINNSK